jgi:hypothetical protein
MWHSGSHAPVYQALIYSKRMAILSTTSDKIIGGKREEV